MLRLFRSLWRRLRSRIGAGSGVPALSLRDRWPGALRDQPKTDLTYFLHIPKTSGTSLSDAMLQAVGPEAMLPPMLWDHLLRGIYVPTHQTRIITGHFGGLLPLWLGRWPKMITMLREPLARALSTINHVQRDVEHPWHAQAANLTVREYCQHPVLQRNVDNLQARYLASLDFALALLPDSPRRGPHEPVGPISVDFESALCSLDARTGLYDAAIRGLKAIVAVGLAEAHEQSLRLFTAKLGWKAHVTEKRKNLAAPGQRRLESLPREDVEALTRLNTVDVAVYEWARGYFQELCHSCGIEPEHDAPRGAAA